MAAWILQGRLGDFLPLHLPSRHDVAVLLTRPKSRLSFLALAFDGGQPPGLTCTRGDRSDASGLSRLYQKHPCSSCRFLWKPHSGCFLRWAECLHPLKIHVFEAYILSAVFFGDGGLWEVSRFEGGALRSGIRAL